MRVLLAEDDKRLGKLIQYMLEQNDIQVEWVTNGNDIYEYAKYSEYDILVLDWMMPGVTGVEACSRLRHEGYEKAILMLTARDSVEDRVTGLDAGADDFQADEECFEIYTSPEDFSAVRDALEEAGFTFAQAELQMVPSNTITLENEEDMARLRKLLDALEDNDDVQHVWHNWENEDDYEG